MNDNDDLTRPSTLLAAVGLGLVVGGALLLADLTRGQLRDMAIYPVAAIVAVGFVLGAWHGGLGLLGFVLLVWDAVTARRPVPAEPAPEVAEVTTAAPAPLALHRSAMKQALSRFFRGGDQAGSFSIRSLTSIVGDGDWAVLTDFYCSDGGGRVLLNRGGPLGTGWGYGWTLDAVLQALNTDKLPLPPFPEGQVPDVALYVANTAQRNTNTRKSKAGAVVEGVAREVGQ